jgi:hypothetical protein
VAVRQDFTAINIVEKNPKLKVAILERGLKFYKSISGGVVAVM